MKEEADLGKKSYKKSARGIGLTDKIRQIMASGTFFGYFLQVLPVTLFAGAVYAIVRIVYLKRKQGPVRLRREIAYLLFVCYLTGLFNLIVLPANFWLRFFDGVRFGSWRRLLPVFRFGSFNFVPSLWKTAKGELTLGKWAVQMLLGNILMFVPLGAFLPFLMNRITHKSVFVFAAAMPLSVELLQLMFGRSFDVDDLICNFSGIVIGYFAAVFVKDAYERKREKKKKREIKE